MSRKKLYYVKTFTNRDDARDFVNTEINKDGVELVAIFPYSVAWEYHFVKT